MKEILVYSFMFCCMILSNQEIAAQVEEKVVSKYLSFPANEQTQLILSNKYGDITCEVWERDSISIFTTISVKSKREDALDKILKSVVIESNDFGNTVELEVAFADNASLVKSYLAKLDPFNSNELEINHVVKFPDGVDLVLVNRFGNIMIEKNVGDIEVDLEYGDLRLESMTGDVDFELKSGRLIGRSLQRANLEIRNFDVRLKLVDYLILDSQASEIKIDKVESARIDLLSGELEIREISNIKGKASNADLLLGKVNKDIQLDIRAASLIVEEFDEDVENVLIDELSSTIDLNISNISFSLDAEMEDAQFSVPKTVMDVERNVLDEKNQHRTISLTYNGGGSTISKFSFKGQRGSFFLIEN